MMQQSENIRRKGKERGEETSKRREGEGRHHRNGHQQHQPRTVFSLSSFLCSCFPAFASRLPGSAAAAKRRREKKRDGGRKKTQTGNPRSSRSPLAMRANVRAGGSGLHWCDGAGETVWQQGLHGGRDEGGECSRGAEEELMTPKLLGEGGHNEGLVMRDTRSQTPVVASAATQHADTTRTERQTREPRHGIKGRSRTKAVGD